MTTFWNDRRITSDNNVELENTEHCYFVLWSRKLGVDKAENEPQKDPENDTV